MTAAKTVWHLTRDGARDRRELVATIPIRTVSETNQREHWRVRHRRRKLQRTSVGLVVQGLLSLDGPIGFPCAVRLTRLALRVLDGDNLQGALKATRDGVADAMGIDDSDRRVTWLYDQRKAKMPGVEVRIAQVSA